MNTDELSLPPKHSLGDCGYVTLWEIACSLGLKQSGTV